MFTLPFCKRDKEKVNMCKTVVKMIVSLLFVASFSALQSTALQCHSCITLVEYVNATTKDIPCFDVDVIPKKFTVCSLGEECVTYNYTALTNATEDSPKKLRNAIYRGCARPPEECNGVKALLYKTGHFNVSTNSTGISDSCVFCKHNLCNSCSIIRKPLFLLLISVFVSTKCSI